ACPQSPPAVRQARGTEAARPRGPDVSEGQTAAAHRTLCPVSGRGTPALSAKVRDGGRGGYRPGVRPSVHRAARACSLRLLDRQHPIPGAEADLEGTARLVGRAHRRLGHLEEPGPRPGHGPPLRAAAPTYRRTRRSARPRPRSRAEAPPGPPTFV